MRLKSAKMSWRGMPSEKLYRNSGEQVVVYNTDSDLTGWPADNVVRTSLRGPRISQHRFPVPIPLVDIIGAAHVQGIKYTYSKLTLQTDQFLGNKWGQTDCSEGWAQNCGIWERQKDKDKLSQGDFILGTWRPFSQMLGEHSATIVFKSCTHEPKRKV